MAASDFTILRSRSSYSFHWGTSSPAALAEETARLGYAHLALADRNSLAAHVPFVRAARGAGLHPILGVEITGGPLRPIDRRDPAALCLALGPAGYRAICRLTTRRQLAETFDLITSLPGILTEAGTELAVVVDDPDLLTALHPIAPRGTLWAGLAGEVAGGSRHEHRLVAAARRVGRPLVAAPEIVSATSGFLPLHRVLVATDRITPADGLRADQVAPGGAHVAPPDAFRRRFSPFPGALLGSVALAERATDFLALDALHLPRLPLAAGETADRLLGRLAREGMRRRYVASTARIRARAASRLDRELSVISTLGMSDYFLIVHDVVDFARQERIPILGRGSAADSLVAYALGITRVCPIRHRLLFERFMNLARSDCPDIDLDISWKRRDEVIRYVYDRHGTDRVAMISTTVRYRTRSAFRDAARALGLPPDELDDLSKRLPARAFFTSNDPALPPDEIRKLPELADVPTTDARITRAIDLAHRMTGLPRHLGIHPGGLVVSPDPLTDHLSLQCATKGIVITQADMDGVESLGLVKMDLLGHRGLAIVHDTLDVVNERAKDLPNENALDTPHPAVRSFLRDGRTIGCTQIESPAMRNLLRMLRAESLRDTIAAIALVRPGPSGSGMKTAYVKRRRGLEPVRHLHPLIAPLLEESFGIMLYQEDVLRVAHVMAGFSTEEADHLRRVISKGRGRAALATVRERFLSGAVSRGMSRAEAESLWTLVTNFAAYSFCKAHAATYGQLAYQALYLKTRFPAEFFASVLSNGGGFYGPSVYLEEARRLGVRILPPDLNESGRDWHGRDELLRPGLRELRYLSERSLDALLAERKRGGAFADLDDFLRRLPIVSPREVESLVSVGAFDFTGRSRPELLLALRAGGPRHRDTSQVELFGATLPAVPTLRPYTLKQRLEAERHALDVFVTDAPLAALPARERRGTRKAAELPGRVGEHVHLIGRLVATRRVKTASGNVMRFCTLEDETGIFEAVLFPAAYRRVGQVLRHTGAYRVEGRVENELGAVTVRVRRLTPLAETSPSSA